MDREFKLLNRKEKKEVKAGQWGEGGVRVGRKTSREIDKDR